MTERDTVASEGLVALTTDIVTAFVGNNRVEPAGVGSLISSVFETLSGLTGEPEEPKPEPAVSVRQSISKTHLICLEDGRKFRTLKRHLKTTHGMSPDEYRERWDLPESYPMVAPGYSKKRSELAKENGLGRLPGKLRGGRRTNAKK